jgi:hypothetical protein
MTQPNNISSIYEISFDKNSKDTAPIRILEGKFKDFVYKYDTIQVGEFDEEAEDVPLSYDYKLLEAPSSYEVDDEEAEKYEFEQLIGDILYDIIVNSSTVKEANNE